MIQKRNQNGAVTLDPASIENLTYNNQSGARKSTEVGRNLLPLNKGDGTFTTDASTIRTLPGLGKNLAVYNSNTTVHAVTLGESSSQAALAAGVTDVSGHVGIPCAPGQWTYIACYLSQYVITDNAALMVFLINDDTYIRKVSNDNASV